MTSNLDAVSNGLSKRLKEYAVRTDEPGRRLIQKSLATSPDPWAAINKLQSELSLGFASSNCALQFLSFLGVSNLDAHTSLFESLKEKIELVVMRLPESHLQMLLKETAVLLSLKELKIIPLSVIKRLSNIPPQYLKLLIEKGLLQELPLVVRRQAWEMNRESFFEALRDPRFDLVHGEPRSEAVVTAICEMIGQSEGLFKSFAMHCVQVCVERKGNTGCLLVKVLLALQETGSKMAAFEKLHDAASLVARCQRQGRVDATAIASLHALLKSLIVAQAAADQRQSLAQNQKNESSLSSAGANSNDKATVISTKPSAKSLRAALDVLFKADTLRLFYQPVTEDIAPGYFARIRHPMDLSTIRKKTDKGVYSSIEDFERDLQLMVRNCHVFNGDASPFALHADKVYAQYTKQKPKIFNSPSNATAGAAAVGKAKETVAKVKETKPSPMPSAATNVSKPSTVAKVVVVPQPPPQAQSQHQQPQKETPSSGEESVQLMKELANAWKTIFKLDAKKIFAQSTKDIDIMVLKERIRIGTYKGFEDFDRDLKLMLRDLKTKHGKDAPETKEGERIYLAWKDSDSFRRLKSFSSAPPPSQSSAPTTSAVSQPPSSVPPAEKLPSAFLAGPDGIKQAWQVLYDLDGAEIFREPVDPDFSDYFKVVKRPIDLATMRKKIDAGIYKSVAEFNNDVTLMFDNCRLFNKKRPFETYGNCLEQLWKDICIDLKVNQSNTAENIPVSERYARTLRNEIALVKLLESEEGRMRLSSGQEGIYLLCCDFLAKADHDHTFSQVVSDREAPDYSSVIKNKMAISVMRKKATQRAYHSLDDFHADVVLIFNNCFTFNTFHAPFSRMAMRFLLKWIFFKAAVSQTLLIIQSKAASATKKRKAPSVIQGGEPVETLASSKKSRVDTNVPPLPPAPSPVFSVDSCNATNANLSATVLQSANQQMEQEQEEDDGLDEETKIAMAVFRRAAERGLYSSAKCANEQELEKLVLPSIPSVAELSSPPGTLTVVLKRCWKYFHEVVDKEKHFAAPISNPEYLAVCERPMDFTTMRVKIDRGKYPNLDKFEDDLVQVAKNHLLFQPIGSPIHKAAARLAFAWKLTGQNARLALGEQKAEGASEVVLPPEHIQQSSHSSTLNRSTPIEEPIEEKDEVRAVCPPTAPANASSEICIQPEIALTPTIASTNVLPFSSHPSSGVQAAARTVQSQGGGVRSPLPPVVPAEASLQFALLLLRERTFHKSLIAHLAHLIKKQVTEQCNASDHGITLFSADDEIRFVLQLILTGCTNAINLYGVDEMVLHYYLPYLVLHPQGVQEVLTALPLPDESILDPDALRSFLEDFGGVYV
eukprot:gene10198-11285_t